MVLGKINSVVHPLANATSKIVDVLIWQGDMVPICFNVAP
uniref:Uncharacterized protein n=1 Tax=Rhizophora mucronata TaxID=61149 RepID=A0A2P2LBV1_RHIMU